MNIMSMSDLPPPPPPPPSEGQSRNGGNIWKVLVAVTLISIIIVATVLLFFFNVIPWPFRPGDTTRTVDYGVVMGKVVNMFGDPLANVEVSVGGRSSTTNDQGWFSISNLTTENRAIIMFSRNNSVSTYKLTDIHVGGSSFVEATISPVDLVGSLNAAVGGTVTTSDNGSVTVGPNSLVDALNNLFSGTAKISVTTFDPSDETQLNSFPGDYIGVSEQNVTGRLKSFGFMDISITSQTGQPLQIASGKNATIKIPVPSSMQSEAASLATCPLWHFNTSTATWRQQGMGLFNSSLGCFVGNITHLSTWNFDIFYPAGYVSGRVVDSNGNPVEGAQVKCWGQGWYQQRWASGETSTNANGIFTRIPVEVGITFKCQASKGGHKSSVLERGPLSVNQEFNVGNITLDAPLVQITLMWGENPRDLDSHLAASLAGNDSFHVYYSQKGSLSFQPYANLDTDDTTSFGPEVTSISRLRQGNYRYSVRHFAGEGTIATSNMEVNMVIPGVGIYRFTPPAGQANGTNIWRVFDITVDSNGRVTSVNPINDYVTGGDESDLLYPP